MIVTNQKKIFNFFPNTIEEEIEQNIRVILGTYRGTVPLNRKFGIDTSFIDNPSNKALIISKLKISEAIQEFEPRVEVTKISIERDIENALNGDFTMLVEVNIKDEFK